MRRGWFWTLLLATCLSSAASSRAWAKANGFPSVGCDGCHTGNRAPIVTITADPVAPDPGQTATITIHVSRSSGPVAGFYLTTNKVGTLSLMGGPIKLISSSEATHSSPSSQTSGDDVIFPLRWTAPQGKGTVTFDVAAVSANGNNDRGGDSAGQGRLAITYGCAGIMAFIDHDGDGFGRDSQTTRVCEVSPGVSLKGGDCDDNNKDAYPGHPEVCNYYDDNCDGKVNEGLENVAVYRDSDGDGHGAKNSTDVRMGCTMSGYSALADDCNDADPLIFPGAPEMCDGIDNNCNGKIDDGAKASCGSGWCRRTAPTCDPKSCVPGPPRAEMCNNFDDDCDGVIDNGANLCDGGRVCYGGYCLTPTEVGDAAAHAGPEPPPTDGGVPVSASGGSGGGAYGAPDAASVTHKNQATALGCSLAGGGAGAWPLLLLALSLLRRRAASSPRR
jgi:hypothetical protein